MKKKSKIVTAVMAGVMCGISTGNGRSFFDSSVSRVCVKKEKNMKKLNLMIIVTVFSVILFCKRV